jgi:hypothetical protein
MRQLIIAAAALAALCLAGCASMSKKPCLTAGEKLTFSEPKDLVLSGKTGELTGSPEDKNPKTAICPDCGYPKGSLRQRIIIAMEQEDDFDSETLGLLRERKDIVISGKTGAVEGSALDKKLKVSAPERGFPKDSPRQRIADYGR